MIDLDSLKEQLQMMGHNLPDDQIMSILKDMNIEIAATAPASALSDVQSASNSYSYIWAPLPPGPPPASSITPPLQLGTEVARMGLTGVSSDAQVCGGTVENRQQSSISSNMAWPQVATYTATTASQPAPIAKLPHEWYGPQYPATTCFAQPETITQPPLPAMTTHQPFTFGASTTAEQPSGLFDTSTASYCQPCQSAYTNTSRIRQQDADEDGGNHHEGHGSDHDDLYGSDNRVDGILARYYQGEKHATTAAKSGYLAKDSFVQDVGYQQDQDRDQQPRSHAGPLPNEYVHKPSILRRVTDDVDRPSVHHIHRPAKYHWQDALRSDEPVSVAQQPSSSSSRRQTQNHAASSTYGGRSSGGGSASAYSSSSKVLSTGHTTKQRKGDVVSRYAQLQDSWSRDKFLSSSAGGIAGRSTVAGSRKVAVATTRKPLNFHTYFKVLHAAEEAKKDMRVKMSREYTVATLNSSSQPRR